MIKPPTLVAVASPSFGPAIITIAGVDIPVMAFSLSICGLLLARSIAPASRRKLTGHQEVYLTLLLAIILLVLVTGQLGFSKEAKPLGAGMAVVWGVGLGFSGLLAVEFFGNAIMNQLRSILGQGSAVQPPKNPEDPK